MSKCRVIMTAGTSLVTNRGGTEGGTGLLNGRCESLTVAALNGDCEDERQRVLHDLVRLTPEETFGRRKDPIDGHEDRWPQELSYLYLLLTQRLPEQQIEVFLLASATRLGQACARTIAEFVETKREGDEPTPWDRVATVEVTPVAKLTQEVPADFEAEGAPNLLATILDLAEQAPPDTKVIINPTGGFKEVIPYATIAAAFIEREWEMHYLFATATDITVLPRYPIGLNFPLWHREEALRRASVTHPQTYRARLDPRMWAVAVTPPNSAQEKLTAVYQAQVESSALQEHSRRIVGQLLDDAPDYADHLLRVVDELGPMIWLGDKLPMAAGHAAEHHCNLLEVAQLLLLPLWEANEEFLSADQRYVLLAALLLHDCGHTLDALPLRDTSEVVRLFPSEVRAWHHLLAFRRITEHPEDLAFDGAPLPREVAHLALYHRRGTGWSSQVQTCRISGDRIVPPLVLVAQEQWAKDIDLPRLIALLRLIDGCDNQSRRVGSAAQASAMQRLFQRDVETSRADLRRHVAACQTYAAGKSELIGLDFIKALAGAKSSSDLPPVAWDDRYKLLFNGSADPVWRELWMQAARTRDEVALRDRQYPHFVKHQAVQRIAIYPDHDFDPASLWSLCVELQPDPQFAALLDDEHYRSQYLDNEKTLREHIIREVSSELLDENDRCEPLNYFAEALGVRWKLTFAWVKDAASAKTLESST